MPVLVLVAGLVLAACGAANLRVWVALSPRTTAWQVMSFLLVSVAFTYFGLVLLAAPALLNVLPRSALTEICQRLLTPWGPAGPLGACLAAGLVAISALGVGARIRRSRRERHALRVECGVGRHESGPNFDLVTLPSPAPLAYSLGGPQPQIVVSHGLRHRLDEAGFSAVVAHEAAHLRARHDRWLGLTSLIETALWFVPWASVSTAALRLSLERWADEEAAQTVGRSALRAALLASVDATPLPSQTAALSRAGALAQRLAMLADERLELTSGLTTARWGWLGTMIVTMATITGGLAASASIVAHLCTL